MKSTRQHKLYLARPLLDCFGLGLCSLVVLLEVVGEVAVEVEASGVVAALTSVALTLARHLVAVRVHRRQDVDPSVVQQPLDVAVRAVAVHQVLTDNRGNNYYQSVSTHIVYQILAIYFKTKVLVFYSVKYYRLIC